ncbi:MAG: tRNA (adenine-N1)-methyltransferase [Acidimicrobiia bacterium]|nr:tRNA (adenine-N1)-methyltransferase [Acidimicrobiia bacterium]
MRRPLLVGESVLLIDGKGRHYLIRLQSGGKFHYHLGVVDHDVLIGSSEGVRVTSTGGGTLLVLRPRLADFVLKMPRGAQVVYPKDMGPIAIYADIGPGMTVLEAGTGSGALTLALLRFVGPGGRVISVERRPDHAELAEKTVNRWLGEVPPNLDLRIGEVEDVIAEVAAERIVLDLPEPWHAAKVASVSQPAGGVLCAYLPTVPQLQTMVEAMEEGGYAEIEVFETLHRTWNISGRSVRPSHRMVGHTGFLVVGRRTLPAPPALNPVLA